MDESLVEKLDSLGAAGLAEAVERLVPGVVGIDEPKTAANRVAALANLPPGAAAELEALAQQTGLSSSEELGALLRAVLADLAETAADGGAAVSAAIDDVGRKQIVIGPELYGICTLLIAAYVAIRTGGKKAEVETIEVTEAANGRTKVKISKRVEYLNPFGPLATLLKRITGDSSAD